MRHPKRAALALAVAATVGLSHWAVAATGTWTTDGSGTWNTPANWLSGTIPNATDDIADFNSINLTAPLATVSLDVPVTIGTMTFGDTDPSSSASWVIQGPNTLTLAVTAGSPTITVNQLGTSGTVTIGTGTLLAGASGLTKAGVGTLILNNGSGNSLTGGTIISGGTLQVGTGGITGSLGAGDVVNNGTLAFNRSDAFTIADSVSGTGNLTKAGAGVLTFNSSANTYTGATTINGGAINFNTATSINSLGTGTVTVNAAGAVGYGPGSVTDPTFNNKIAAASTGALAITTADAATNFDFTTGAFAPLGNMSIGVLTGNAVVYTGSVTPANSTFRFGGGGGSITLPNALTGAGNSAVFGPAANNSGTVIITANNSYGGTTTINAGTTVNLGADNGNAGTFGAGAITNNGAISLRRSDNTTIGNTITGTGSITRNNPGFVGTPITTFTGNITQGALNVPRGSIANAFNSVVFDLGSNTASFSALSTVGGTTTAGGGGRLTLTSGNLTFTGGLRNDNNDGAIITINNGTFTANDVTLARTGGTTNPAFPGGFIVAGGIANIGTMELGNTSSNSWGVANFNGGTTTITGIVTVGQTTNAGRGGAFQINNGTLNITEPTFGLVMGRANGTTTTTQQARGFLQGGVANISKITFGYDNTLVGGAANFDINNATATLYMGAGGIVKNSPAGHTAVMNLQNGTVAANANWSSDALVPWTILGTGSTFKAADASNTPFNITINGAVAGSGPIFKTGGGILDLQGSNTNSGPATVNAGTLSGKASSLRNTITNNATVAFNDLSGSSTFTGVIQGTGNVTKTGAGISLVNSGQTYTGSTTVNQGTLGIKGGNTTSSGFTVNNGGGLMVRSGGATVSNLTFGATGTDAQTFFANDGSGLSTLTTTGLTTNGTTTVDVGVTGLTVGTKVLIDYSGSILGSGFGGFTLGTLPPRMIAGLVNNTSNTSVDLNITGFDFPRWNGNVSGTWDINTTPNWKTVTGNTTTTYLQATAPGDQVLFDDNAAGVTAVEIPGTVQPSIITVSNNNKNYTFSGAGKISGVTPLVKNGTGSLTVSNTGGNDYTGGTTINAGSLVLGVANALPAAGAITVAGGTWDLNGQSPVYTGGITLSGGTITNGTLTKNGGSYDIQSGKVDSTAVLTGSAGLIKSGTGTAVILGTPTYTGQTVVNNGNLQLGDGVTTGTVSTTFGAILNSGTITFNPGGLQIFGGQIAGFSGTIVKDGPQDLYVNGFNEGNAIVNGGTLVLVSNAATGASVAPRIARGGLLTINSGATVLCQGNNALGLNSANLPPAFLLNAGGILKGDASTDTSVYNGTFAGGILTVDPSATAMAIRGDYGVQASTSSMITAPGFTMTLNNAVNFTMGAGAVMTIDVNLSSVATDITSFTGPGTMFLTGNNVALGIVNVSNGAILDVASTSNLGGANAGMSMNGGTLRTSGSFAPETHNFTLNGTSTIDTNGFDSTFSGTFAGSGGLTKAGAGTLVLSGTGNAWNGTTTVNAGTLRLEQGNLTTSPAVNVNSGTLVFPSDATFNRMIRTGAVSVATGGKLNLDDNKMIVTGVGATGTWAGTGYTGVTGLVASGRSGNTWSGSGIVTSQTAAVNSNYTSIGVALASDVRPATATATDLWGGQTITGTDTLVMYTYGGDATLDGKLNIDDYVKIDSGIAAGLTGWSNGDFNYDGKVNIDDYTTVIDANIGNQSGVFPTAGGVFAGGGSGVSAVPEPASISIIALAAIGTLRRQRRRSCSGQEQRQN